MERKMPNEERAKWLLDLGLTDGEARAYLALVDGGPAPASEIAKSARVPRNRVYDVLESLAAKDLVDIRLETVRTFAARPVDRFLAGRREELARRRADLEEKRDELRGLFGAPSTKASDEPTGLFRFVRGRRDAIDALARMLRTAERRVLVHTTTATLARLDNHASGSEVVPALLARGVEVRIAAWGEGEPPAELAGVVRRASAPPATHRFVIDDREVAYLAPAADDDRVYVGDDRLLITDAAALVREAVAVVDAAIVSDAPSVGTVDPDEARRLVLDAVANARTDILVVGRALAVTLAHALPALQAAARRGTRVRVVLGVDRDHSEVAKRLARVAEVRHAEEPALGLLAADDALLQVTPSGNHRALPPSKMLSAWATSLWQGGAPLLAHLADDRRAVVLRTLAGLPGLVGRRPARFAVADREEADAWTRPGRHLVVLDDANPASAVAPPLLLGAAVVGDHAYFWPYRRRDGRARASGSVLEIHDDRLVGALEERLQALDPA